MIFKEDDNDLFYYDGFTDPGDIFNWIFEIENTLEDISGDKHVEYVSSKLIGHAYNSGQTHKQHEFIMKVTRTELVIA